MCRFFSGVVTKNKTYVDYDDDSHEEILKKAGLTDNDRNPTFMRVELCPEDGDVWNHDIKNWKLGFDQDFKPDWFEERWAEEEMRNEIKKLWEERFVTGKKFEIKRGRWWIGGNAKVYHITGTAHIADISGSAYVDSIGGAAVVNKIHGDSVIDAVGEHVVVRSISGSACINYMFSRRVNSVCESAHIKNTCSFSFIHNISGFAKIDRIRENSICRFYSEGAKFGTIEDNGMAILCYNCNEIVVANKNIKLKYFE